MFNRNSEFKPDNIVSIYISHIGIKVTRKPHKLIYSSLSKRPMRPIQNQFPQNELGAGIIYFYIKKKTETTNWCWLRFLIHILKHTFSHKQLTSLSLLWVWSRRSGMNHGHRNDPMWICSTTKRKQTESIFIRIWKKQSK